MTREEQIRKYAEEKCALCDNIGFDGDVYSLVVESIEWADTHPSEEMVSLDDVCEFLDEHLYTSTSTGDYDYGQEYICSDFDNATDLIFTLRKTMEEK